MMRDKKRYLLLKFDSAEPLRGETAKYAVYESVLSFLGEQGASKAALQLLEFDEAKQLGLAKCALDQLDSTIAALALKRKFQNRDIAIRILKVSALANHLWKSTKRRK